MAKKGMARPEPTHLHPKNLASPVPEIQGKAKCGKEKAKPIIAGTEGAHFKVYHEKSIPNDAYGPIDSDLARDNLENNIPYADLQDI